MYLVGAYYNQGVVCFNNYDYHNAISYYQSCVEYTNDDDYKKKANKFIAESYQQLVYH